MLPKASCHDCEKITSGFEDHCVKGMIDTARYHLGLKGRRAKTPRTKAIAYIDHGDGKIEGRKVALDEHPSALLSLALNYPGVLVGSVKPAVEDIPVGRVVMRSVTEDLAGRSKRLGGKHINLTRGFASFPFYRMLGKIAHAYAAAELGVNGFESTVRNLILERAPMWATHYVGSTPLIEEDAQEMHEIGFEEREPYIPKGWRGKVVRVRLFAKYGMPTHLIAVDDGNIPRT